MANFSISYQFKAMIGNFENNIEKMKKDIDSLDQKQKKFNFSAQKMGKGMKTVGKSMFRNITLPVLGIGTAGIYSFAKLEKGLIKVKGLVKEKATWDTFKSQFETAQTDAVKLGFSIDDVNKSLFALPSGLGVNKSALDGYRAALKLAIAGDADLAAASEGMIRVMAGYGDSIQNAEQAASAFFQAQVIGVTDVQLLASNIGKVVATSRLASLSLGEMMATAAGMTKVLPTEQALTAMNALLSSLLTPTPEQKKTIMAIGRLYKIDLPVGAKALQKSDFFGVLDKIIDVAKRNPDALTALIPERRAIKAMGSLTTETMLQMRERAKMIDTDKKMIELNQAFNDQYATSTEKLKRFKGELVILLAKLGKQLFPLLKSFMYKILIPFIRYLTNLSPVTKKWIIAIALLTAAIGPLLIILGSLLITLSFFMAHPIIALITGIIIAIGALTAGIIYLYKNWNKILISIKNIGKNVFGWLKNIVADITAAINKLINAFLSLAKLSPAALFQKIKGGVSGAYHGVKEFLGFESATAPAPQRSVTTHEMQGNLIIETRDNGNVIKKVIPKANLGLNMTVLPAGYFD